MELKNSKCLLLNSDYTPLSVISWKRALIWSIKNEYNNKIGVQVLDFYKNDYILGTNNKKHPIPAIVKTIKYFRINQNQVKFSRKNLFIRDNYTCQYCDSVFDTNNLTYDHVIPKSIWDHNIGSPTSWTNIVTACISCNRKKRNRTPKQANMPLKNIPYVPQKNIKYLPIVGQLVKIKSDIPQEWKPYLPISYF